MSAFKRSRTDYIRDDGYETDKTEIYDQSTHSPQDEVHDSLLQEFEELKREVARLTKNLSRMPPTPPTERVNHNTGESLYIYEKANDLYTKPGQEYKGADLYHFLPLTRDGNKDEPVYDKDGNELPKENLFGQVGKGRRTTQRKRGNKQKSCKRTKKC